MVLDAQARTDPVGRVEPWADTREWLERVKQIGQLREVSGVDWQQGIGEVTELLDHTDGSPAVLFDDVPGYPRGYRVLVNANATPQRQAVTLGAATSRRHARRPAQLLARRPRRPSSVAPGRGRRAGP